VARRQTQYQGGDIWDVFGRFSDEICFRELADSFERSITTTGASRLGRSSLFALQELLSD
jgi:hypothetical protein